MYKKVSLIVSVLCLAMFLSFANAQEYTIGDYDFIWRVAKVGEVPIPRLIKGGPISSRCGFRLPFEKI